MNIGVIIWGIEHKGREGFNKEIFKTQSEIPLDVKDSLRDIRIDNIYNEEVVWGNFYSIITTKEHRIYTIYSYTTDSDSRVGFLAISIYIKSSKQLSNIKNVLDSCLSLYQEKKDSTYDSMFDDEISNLEEYPSYYQNVESKGTGCFFAENESRINHFLETANSLHFHKIYITDNNELIRNKYPKYENKKVTNNGVKINTPPVNLTKYIYLFISILIISLFIFLIYPMLESNPTNNSPTTNNKLTYTDDGEDNRDFKIGSYSVVYEKNGDKSSWHFIKEDGSKTNYTETLLIIKNYKTYLKKDYLEELDNIKIQIQKKLMSDQGIKIHLLKSEKDFPENIEHFKKETDKDNLEELTFRYKNISFERLKGSNWRVVNEKNNNLLTNSVFKFYLRDIGSEPKQDLETEEDEEDLNHDDKDEKEEVKKSKRPKKKMEDKEEDKVKCTNHNNVTNNEKLLEKKTISELENLQGNLNQEYCRECSKKWGVINEKIQEKK